MRRVETVLVVGTLLSTAWVWPQTTSGRLMGTTVDASGAALPGVRVTISSPALIGGAQTKTTNDLGEYLFLLLAPGDYTVRAERAGFISQERNLVTVPLGGAAVLTIEMPAGPFSGEIEVYDESPVVDPSQVNTGQIFELTYMQDSAIGSANRNYLTIVNQTAGVAGGGSWSGFDQPRVFGSTIGENAYFIDGMDVTDPTMATATVPMNFDAVGEIQFQTGGFEAEYGRATGGIMNLVTKSGGNRFSGTFDARYREGSFQEGGDHFDAAELDTSFQQFSATLGGPIVLDRVWFFTAYEWNRDEFTPVDAPTTRTRTGANYLAKITWQIDPSWRLTGRASGAPSETDNSNASRWVSPEATAFASDTSSIFSGELSAVLSDSLLWRTSAGNYRFDTESYPRSGDLRTIGHYNFDTGLNTVNYGNQQYWGSERYDFTTDLTWFVDELAGTHEFKFGVEYSDIALPDDGLCSTGTPNGERCEEGIPGFFFGDIEFGGTLPFFMIEDYGYTEAKYSGAIATAFVQDAWRPTRDLTLKLGLRYDAVNYDNDDGEQIFDDGVLQPRLGFAWDLGGGAKNVLRGSWGRFVHPGSLAAPAWATTQQTISYYWYSCSGAVPLLLGIPVASAEECAAAASALGFPYRLDNENWDPLGWMLPPWEVYGSEPAVFAPNLRATYADELILAFEREVGRRASLEITYVDKKTRDVFDDTCNGNVPAPTAGADCSYWIFANLPELRRDYEAFILRYENRGLSWLTLLASYTYSSSEGSVEYTQNAGSVADVYPWHFDNRYGYLSDHRRHRFKLNGFFSPGGDWTIAFDAYWTSPFTWAPYENRIDNPAIPYGTHFLEPRGSREGDDQYQLDLQLSKGFRAGPLRVVLIGSAFNVFSSEQPIAVCERISGCGEFEMGDATSWQVPRRYEVGFRVEF